MLEVVNGISTLQTLNINETITHSPWDPFNFKTMNSMTIGHGKEITRAGRIYTPLPLDKY